MKKFLFTLAALLMMTSAFAQTDAKYLYVNTALTEQANADPEAWGLADGEMVFVISADIPAYMSAFEVWVDVPEGITYTMWECGADGAITYWNARHAQQTLTPTPTTSQAGPQHSLLAIQTEGYYQIDGVWTKVGAVKWAPGHYDEFMLLFATYTEDYHGGIINIDTAPSSGADPRGQTVNDLGDMGVHHVTPPTEPLPDPNAAAAWADAVVTNMGVVDGWLTYKIEWEDGGDLYIDNEKVEGVASPYMYKVAAQTLYEQEGSFFVQVKGDGKDDSNNVRYAWTLDPREATYAPEPTLTWDADANTMTVTVPEGYSVVVTGPNGTETITETTVYTITPTYNPQSGIFSAYTEKKTEDYNSATVTKPYSVDALPTTPSETPEISVVDNGDGTYTITATPTATTTMMDGDGNELDNPYIVAQPEIDAEDLVIFITATNDEGVGHTPTSVTERVVIPAKQRVAVEDPVITYEIQTDKVVVYVQWPETDGEKVYTGQETYPRPEYGQADEQYTVYAQTLQGPTCLASNEVSKEIPVPAKDPVWQDVAAPVITTTMDDNNVYVTINWPETTGNQVYTGQETYPRPEYGQPDESYDVQAWTEADYPYKKSDVAEATIEVPAKEQVVPVEDNIYVKFDGTELPVGKKIIFVYENGENSYAFGPIASGKGNPVNVVVENNEVNIANTDVIEFTVGGGDVAFSTDIKTYTLEYTDGYLAYNSSTNFKTLTSIGQYDSDAYWRLQSVTGGYALNNNASTNRYIRKHATSNKFGPYAVNADSEIVVIYIEKSDEPEAPAAPVITFSGEETTTMTVTVTAEEGCTLIVNGEEIDNNTYTYTVDRDDIYTAGTVEVTATAVKDGVESDEATGSKDFVVEERPIADEPVIQFVETKDGNIVTEVEVVVTDATSHTVYVNGAQLRGEKIFAAYDEVKNIHVEATNDPGYPEVAKSATGDYTLNKLVAAPVITTDVQEDKVVVNITWPTTDGNNVYTGEYTYDRGEADQSFNVEAYTTAAGEYQESFHATATIEVPALEQTPDQTADPVITTTTGKYNEGYINITCADENAVIYYRYQLDDGEWTEWTEYEGPVMLVENGHYNIEAKAQDPEKEMSNVVEGELTVSDCTAVYEVTTGKAIANVRYFNLAGQEMQEANGMTIIVTTYTDGTTSAVKVMK